MNFFKSFVPLALVCGALFTLAGCGGSSNENLVPPSVTGLSLSPSSTALLTGGTQQLTATVSFSTGGTQALTQGVTYTSDNTNVATVSGSGLVTASSTNVGTAHISATAIVGVNSTVSTTTPATFTVAKPPVTLQSISVSPSVTLAPNTTQQLTVTGTYSDGSMQNLTASASFQPDSTTYVSVNTAGLVTAGSTPGVTNIKATVTVNGTTFTTPTAAVITVAIPQTTTAVLSTGFNSNGTTTTTGGTGTYATYFGGQNNPAGGAGGGYADQGTNPSYEYQFVQDTAANLAGYTYQGITIKPNANQTVTSAGFNSLSFTLAVNQEWFTAGANFVILIAGNVTGTSTATCNPTLAAVVTATASAATAYTVPLTAFSKIVQNCGNAAVTAAQILAAPVAAVDFQADGGGAALTVGTLTSTTNTTVAAAGSSPATFPTTVNVVGGVSFVNAAPPPPPTTTNILSTGFNSTGTTTTSGGAGTYATYFGGQNNPQGGAGGAYADQGTSPSYEYVFTQDTAANLAGYTYQGITIKPDPTQSVVSTGYNSLGFTLAVNPEWFSAGANFVVLLAGNVAGTSTATCNPTLAAVVTATASAATAYTVPLTAFSKIVQNCGNAAITAAQILAAPVAAIDFQADGGGAAITVGTLTSTSNTTVAAAGSSPATFPTTVNVVGGVSFVNGSAPPPPPTTTNVLSTGFNSTGTTTTTGGAGTYATYFGGQNNPAGGAGGGYADSSPAANPSFEYVYTQDTAANLAGYTYQGISIKPDPNQTVSSSGYDSLSFSLAVNPEWLSAGTPNFVVLLAGNVAGTSTATCNPTLAAVVTATASSATAYTVPLTAFTKIAQNCGNAAITAAQILAAPVAAIDFQADGGGAALTVGSLTSNTNTTVAASGSSPATFPTTLNVVGGVSFVNASSPPPATTNVLSTGFNTAMTTTTSVSGQLGSWVTYSGGANNPAGGNGGGYADASPPANPSFEYVYLQDTVANLGGYTYQGITIKPATAQTVSSTGKNNLSFTLGINPEWFQAGPANFVVIISGNVTGTSTATCNPEVAAVVTATASAATAYLVPLSSFTRIVQNCGNAAVTVAQILAAPVTALDFQADGGGAAITVGSLTSNTNTTVAATGTSPATYPTTISVSGGISFAP